MTREAENVHSEVSECHIGTQLRSQVTGEIRKKTMAIVGWFLLCLTPGKTVMLYSYNTFGFALVFFADEPGKYLYIYSILSIVLSSL